VEVIIASNNVFRLELSAFLLAEAGYTVREVTDSTTLWSMIEEAPPLLVVLDSQLTELSDVLPERLRVPVLVLSSRKLPSETVQALRAVGGDYLAWPYQPDDLIDRVQQLQPGCAREFGAEA
jgi:DNA-binding response OmpR family regulator